MARRRGDIISVIEAAYSLEEDESAWVDRLADAVHPLLDHGLGTFVHFWDERRPAGHQFWGLTTRDLAPELAAAGAAYPSSIPRAQLRRLYARVPCFGSASRRLGQPTFTRQKITRERFAARGAPDGIAATAGCGDGRGVAMAALLPELDTYDRRLIPDWTCVAIHVAAAHRLRCHFLERDVDAPLDHAEAILDPAGRVEHATGPAKSARTLLREAARRVDRARGKLRRDDATESLRLWRALVDGRWSLVDHFDSDGRRFVLACKNARSDTAPRGLTQRERQIVAYAAAGHSNKVIAYDMGISPGTVASILSSAMDKLGVRSRVELVRLLGLSALRA